MALYLHNAIYIPNSPPGQLPPRQHSRTTSSGTLRTLTSDSHPTQPLLSSHPDSQSLAYQDLLSRQPSHPHGPEAGWDMGLSLDGHAETQGEKTELQQHLIRRRLRRLKYAVIGLQAVIAIWAAYSAIRYFIAFKVYATASTGQALCVALGTANLVSLSYLACTGIMRMLRPWLESHYIPLHYARTAENIFRSLASAFFMVPTVVNFILLFVFKYSSDSQLVVSSRCRLDADLVWSVQSTSCNKPDSAWGSFVGVSGLRVILSIAIVVLYHSCVFSFQQIVRYPSGKYRYTSAPHRRRRRYPRTQTLSSVNAPLTMSISSTGSVPTSRPPPRTTNSSPPLARVPSDTSRRTSSATPPQHSGFSNRSPSPIQEHYFTEADVERLAPLAKSAASSPDMSADSQNSVASNAAVMDDRDLNMFVDQFRSLVSQISREAEEAIEFAQPNTSTDRYSRSFDMGPQRPSATLSYDEYGRPYSPYSAPEEHVRILNGYVRKMPTIESIGSRELGSTRSTTWDYEPVEREVRTSFSRPPTQLTIRTDSTTDYGHVIRSAFGGGSLGTPRTPGSFVDIESFPFPAPPSPTVPFPLTRTGSMNTNNTHETGHSNSTGTGGASPASGSTAEESGATSFHTAGSDSPRLHPYRTASPVPGSPI